MYTAAASALMLLAAGASARALPQDDCASVMEYKELKQSDWFYSKPKLAIGWGCTSVEETNCELTKGKAHTVGHEYSISGGVSTGLDIGKIFSLGVEAGFTYTWSTSDETSEGATLICPVGGIECGAQVTDRLVKITGKTRVPPGGLGCSGDNDWHDFELTAPLKTSEDSGAESNFQVCLMGCGSADFPNSCDAAYPDGKAIAPICPSVVTAPCHGSFGGVCETVPI